MNLGLLGAMFLPQRAIVPNPPVPDVPRLRISGSDIINYLGVPVLLRGHNWGRWGFATQAHAQANKLDGANKVRFGLRWYGKYDGTAGTDSRLDSAVATAGINPANLAILDAEWDWAEENGLQVGLFVDSDCGQSGKQNAEEIAYCDPGGIYPAGHNFWQDPDLRARWIAILVFLVLRYADRPNFAWLEPCTEPDPEGVSQADVTTFYDECIVACRAALVAAGKAPILYLVGPIGGYDSLNIAGCYNPAWNDVVYTANILKAHNDPASKMNRILSVRAIRNVPVHVQQVGVETSEDPTYNWENVSLALCTDNNVGFDRWEYEDGANANGYGITYRSGGAEVEKTERRAIVASYLQRPPAVLPPPPAGVPVATAVPILSDTTPTIGNVLSFSGDTYTNSPTAFSYRWQRGNSNISGATAATYTVVAADSGKKLRIVVTPSNLLGTGDPNPSANSATVV